MRRSLLWLALACLPAAAGEEDLFGAGGESATESPLPFQAVLSGTLEARFVRTGTATAGFYAGPGLTRYGATQPNAPLGVARGDDPDTTLKLPQVGLDLDVLFKRRKLVHIQFNYDDSPTAGGKVGSVGVVQAYALATPMPSVTLKAGLFFPPISLEHPGAAWSTAYTLTPSAINTWVGEELRPVALEVTWEGDLGEANRLRLTAGVFSHNDPAGTLLAWRGWALHDYQLKVGDGIRHLADIPAPPPTASGFSLPFKELDGRPGVYGKAALEWGTLRLEALGYHNLADPTRADHPSINHDYAWRTQFAHLGVSWEPAEGLTLLTQAMYGSTVMGPPAVDNTFASAFLLASYRTGPHRLTGRADWFEVRDRDAMADANGQRGGAATVAYFHELSAAQRLAVEYVHPWSERPGNSGRTGDPYDDLFQLSYRVIF